MCHPPILSCSAGISGLDNYNSLNPNMQEPENVEIIATKLAVGTLQEPWFFSEIEKKIAIILHSSDSKYG